MKSILATFVALALCLHSSPAQVNSVVVPRDCAAQAGDGSHLYPFSCTVIRDQVLVRADALAGTGGTITGLAFRQDGTSTSTYPARTYALQLDLGQTPVSPAQMTSSFAGNRGTGSLTTVFNGNLKLPAMAPSPTRPAPFTAALKFTRSYPFTTKGGNLVFEFIGTATSPSMSSYRVDGISRARVARATVQTLGRECTGKGGEKATLFVYQGSWVPGGVAHISWTGTSGITAMVSWLGNRCRGNTPFPLPLDLAALGAPGCSLLCNILLTDCKPVKGTFAWGPLPKDPTLAGRTLYTQGAVAVPGANQLGLLLSQAEAITIGSTTPTSDLHCNYSTFKTNSSTGWCFSNKFYGPVMEIRGSFN